MGLRILYWVFPKMIKGTKTKLKWVEKKNQLELEKLIKKVANKDLNKQKKKIDSMFQ